MKKWYVLNTKPKKENQVESLLLAGGFTVYNPKFIQDNRVFSFFPGYEFILFDYPEQYRLVKYTRGVKKIIGYMEGPVAIEEKVIQSIRMREINGFVELDKYGEEPEVGDEIRVMEGPLKGLTGLEEELEVSPDLLLPGPGEESQDGPGGIQAMGLRKSLEGRKSFGFLQKGMAHEHCFSSRIPKDLLFEWKDDGDSVCIPGEFLGPAGLPRPDLRSDVIENGNPLLMGRPGDSEIEAGVVDGENQIHPAIFQEGVDLLLEFPEKGEMPDDLDEAHDGQLIQPRHEIHAQRRHSVPPQAKEACVWPPLEECSGHLRPMEVSRGLSGQHQDDRTARHGHLPVRSGTPGTR